MEALLFKSEKFDEKLKLVIRNSKDKVDMEGLDVDEPIGFTVVTPLLVPFDEVLVDVVVPSSVVPLVGEPKSVVLVDVA